MPDDMNTVALINEYMDKIKTISTREKLRALNVEYSMLFEKDTGEKDIDLLKPKVYSLVSELIVLREERGNKKKRGSTELSETEHSEIYQVQKLLDFNLFTYHFQPIVRADNGEIYSYEALMRARDMQGITPFHILKYAEMTDRLGEIERYTFLNVLHYIREHGELFNDRPVFINSMPNVHIDPVSSGEIGELLELLADKVVVEMTENSEYNDAELNDIKEKYRGLNIRIAIDDYGTGYSNISNLLRYTPNYVKIDRSLLSGIQNNPNKKHFVREIIDFCHDNGILALAEGVENSEELRTVILLGADLIQGFYVARPTPEVITAIPYELRAEIRTHREERENGRRLRIYTAENGERIALDKLQRDGYSIIRVGIGYNEGTVTVTGTPGLDSGIHIETAENHSGTLILDTATLSAVPGKPCVDIGDNSRITISLTGNSRLSGGGIRVPETSELRLEGNGNIEISLAGADYYGIGNDMNSAHGELVFEQEGTVSISSDSHAGVCIGAGLGGTIRIGRGRYVLKGLGSMSVCIGAFSGHTDIRILGCDIYAQAGGAHSAVIGSVNGSADINARYSSIKCTASGILAVAFGTILGERAAVDIESVRIGIELGAEGATAFGALYNDSDIRISCTGVRASEEGKKVLLLGGYSGNGKIDLNAVDMKAKLSSTLERCCFADKDDLSIIGGNYQVLLNGREQEQ